MQDEDRFIYSIDGSYRGRGVELEKFAACHLGPSASSVLHTHSFKITPKRSLLIYKLRCCVCAFPPIEIFSLDFRDYFEDVRIALVAFSSWP